MKLCPTCQQCYEDAYALCIYDQAALVLSRPGTRLITQKYSLDRLLGRSGTSAIYAGTHLETDRPVAIKLLRPDAVADPEALKHFRQEALAAAHLNTRVNHQRVAKTYDYGLVPDGTAYIVMELVAGQTLRAYMDSIGPLPTASAVRLARQVADGLQAAHHCGVVHGDLKPSNIIVARDYHERLEAKVIDFGFAKLRRRPSVGKDVFASTEPPSGESCYMAPEQRVGRNFDERSDIYSLGVILYEMLTGRLPLGASTGTAAALKMEGPPPLTEFRAGVPEQLSKLVMQSLDGRPSARPYTVAAVARQLRMVETSEVFVSQDTLNLNVAASASPAPGSAINPPLPAVSVSPPASVQKIDPSVQEYELKACHPSDLPLKDSDALLVEHNDASNEVAVSAATAQEAVVEQATPRVDSPLPAASLSLTEVDMEAPALVDSKIVNIPAAGRHHLLVYASLAVIGIALGIVSGLWVFPRLVPLLTSTSPAVSTQSSPPAISLPQQVATASVTGSESLPPVGADSPPVVKTESLLPAKTEGLPPVETKSLRPAETKRPQLAKKERAALLAARDQWLAATNTRDVEKQMTLYMPKVDTFYRSHNASRADVRTHKSHVFAKARSIDMRAGEPEITLAGDGRTATMLFRKQYTIKGKQNIRGEAVQELRWLKTDAGWKIISERNVSESALRKNIAKEDKKNQRADAKTQFPRRREALPRAGIQRVAKHTGRATG